MFTPISDIIFEVHPGEQNSDEEPSSESLWYAIRCRLPRRKPPRTADPFLRCGTVPHPPKAA